VTPDDAARQLEKLPAATVKLKLIEALEWQASHPLPNGTPRPIVHGRWYIERILKEWAPRPPRAGAAGRERIAQLVKQASRL
jgi:hypothetical protein